MIRINLLKDVGGGVADLRGPSDAPEGTGFALGGSLGDSSTQDVPKKVIAFLIPFIGIFIYGMYVNHVNQEKLQTLNAELSRKKQRVAQLEPQITAIKRFQDEKNKLEVQVEAIKTLSTERLLAVKALDAIQQGIPTSVWLTGLDFDDKKVKIAGNAIEDVHVSDFMQGLTDSIYFENVMLLRTSERKDKSGVVKAFEIQCNLAMGR